MQNPTPTPPPNGNAGDIVLNRRTSPVLTERMLLDKQDTLCLEEKRLFPDHSEQPVSAQRPHPAVT